jgi:uncharacterized membrane protein
MREQALSLTRRLATWMVPIAAIVVITTWLWVTPPGLLGKADSLGYAVCHRIEERSFDYHTGEALPLCARCSGMYLGAVLGLVYQLIAAPRHTAMPRWQLWIPLGLFATAFAFDGGNSYFYLIKTVTPGRLDWIPTFYVPNNTLRLLTGSGMGLGIAAALYPAFNQTFWRNGENTPALTWKSLGIMTALMAAITALVLTDADFVLYPAAIISAGGVLMVLTLVYSMVWVMLMRQENEFTAWGETGLALLAGLTIALIQITAIDLFRFWLTGTWGGFPLG